ncbi:Fe-S cluster assembly protein SufD [Apibacter mensalis]|uniref:Fe-S cluster assembly protein SufD n=1 Tax=Apibacter mensalis TaxID=1586267 RepID=A0A0X3APE0_9FLAO|nr:Fe-S cluster assembly protein SufD [Apibacter mensalis]CVK17009.1 Fe-S cluster assembly protein SufD [Apibacter mensalis]
MNILQHTELEKITKQAQSTLENSSFPTKKNEDWKFTEIADFNPKLYQTAKNNPISKEIIEDIVGHEPDSFKIVIIDGLISSEYSNYPQNTWIVLPFSEALKNEKYQAIILSKLNSISCQKHYFNVLNMASYHEGTFIYVPKHTIEQQVIELIYLNSKQDYTALKNLRNLFVIEDQSEIQISERIHTLSEFKFFNNIVTEIFVGKNTNFSLYKIQDDVHSSCLMDSTFIRQEKDSNVFMHTFSFGGKTIRNELSFDHNGENINSTLKGVTIIGEGQEVGNHTLVKHNRPNCESHELYRGIYQNSAHGIFNGKIKVNKIAQKTNAFQQNNNILLSKKSSIDTKPQLEIFADDVKCSHGCTVGQLDNDALFYLKQRGIHEKNAKALLMFAFCADVMETVSITQLKNKINKIIAKKLDVNSDFEI